MAAEAQTLGKRAMRAAAWGYIGMLGKLVIQLGSQIVLARMLGPETYGLFAIGAIVVGLSNFFADAGIGAVLVQRDEIDDALVQFVQTCQWMAGLMVSSLLVAGAPLIAQFFNEPRAVNIIRVMSAVCLLSSVASVPANLLRRRLNFKPLQVAQVSGFFIGYVLVGIPCAWAGLGVWSLVLAWLVQALVNALLLLRAARPPMHLGFSAPKAREALAFGGNALLSNIFTWAGTSVDKVVVGRYFPAAELGLYNVANNLLSTAVAQVLSTLQSVLFSASSRVASDPAQIRRAFLALLEIGTLVLLPVFFSIAVVPDVVLGALYGAKWQAGALLLTPIALSMAMYGAAGVVTPLFWSIGRVDAESRIQLGGAVCILLAGTWAAQTGHVIHVAWAVAVCIAARAVFTVLWLARLTSTPLANVARALGTSTLVAVLTAGCAYLTCKVLMQKAATSQTSALLLAMLLAGTVLLGATVAFSRHGALPAVFTLAGRSPRLARLLGATANPTRGNS